MKKNILRVACLGMVSGMALMTAAAPAYAQQLEARREFNIRAQPLASALLQLSRQSDVVVAAPARLTRGRSAPTVRGTMTVSQALDQLLANSGLAHRASGGSIIIERASAATPGSGEDRAGGAAANGESAEQSASPEILVTGTRIVGSAPVGVQTIVISEQQIRDSGQSTLRDVLRQIPQNFGGSANPEGQSFGGSNEGNLNGAAGIDLRGFGTAGTLVLINGRRQAPSGAEGTFVDISNIPLTLVERVEIVTDGGSAIYGSDAIGGVVNIILRQNFNGFSSFGRASLPTAGGGESYLFSQSGGASWRGGQALLSYEYYRQEPLRTDQREVTSSADLRRFGGGDFRNQFSNPGNIFVGGQFYAIPQGQDGRNLSPSDFAAGTTNRGEPLAGADTIGFERRHSLSGSVRQNLNEDIEVFINGRFSDRQARYIGTAFTSTITVIPTNPFYVNPTGGNQAVQVFYDFGDDFGNRITESRTTSWDISIGSRASIGRFELNVNASYSEEQLRNDGLNNINFTALSAAASSANENTAFNPFGDGSFTSPQVIDTIRNQTEFDFTSSIRSADLSLSGPLISLPTGDVRAVFGAEIRQQDFESTNVFPPTVTRTRYARRSLATFAELLVPLNSAGRGLLPIGRVNLSLAGRYDWYSDFDGAASPRVGIEWSPISDVTFRGSWSRSFKAPTPSNLNEGGNLAFILPSSDPSSPTGSSPVLRFSGGNADLRAERGRAWNVGVDFRPRFVPNLTFSLTYFDTIFFDRVQGTSGLAQALSDPTLAFLVNRNPTAEDRQRACRFTFLGNFAGGPANCLTAPIVAIVDARFQNITQLSTNGLDFNVRYRTPAFSGTLSADLNVNYTFDLSRIARPGAPEERLLNRERQPVDFRARGGIAWENSSLRASILASYIDDYRDRLTAGGARIGSWTTFDATLVWSPEDLFGLGGFEFSLTAINIFAERPPFFNNPAGVAYDPQNANAIGRVISLGIRREW